MQGRINYHGDIKKLDLPNTKLQFKVFANNYLKDGQIDNNGKLQGLGRKVSNSYIHEGYFLDDNLENYGRRLRDDGEVLHGNFTQGHCTFNRASQKKMGFMNKKC